MRLVQLAVVVGCLGGVACDMSGFGYSSDTQQVPTQACFAATARPISEIKTRVQLDEAVSFTEFQSGVRRSIAVGFGVDMFSVDAEVGYMRSVQESSFTMSLNYYSYSSGTVDVEVLGAGTDALTPFGKQLYKNGTNPYFRVVCGDNYLTSYQEGAMLMLSINIAFTTSSDKEEFTRGIGVGVADILSASVKIQQVATQLSIKGTVSMQAFQIGGVPSHLAKVLSQDSSGNYYVLSCNLTNMEACQKAAGGLRTYAASDFPGQYSFGARTGLSYLGQGFFTYNPLSYIGLATTESMVTPAVTASRKRLAEALQEAQYYMGVLVPAVQTYAVAWNKSTEGYKALIADYETAQQNIQRIINYNDPEKGGKGCFDYPDKCVDVAESILSGVRNITGTGLAYLEGIEYNLDIWVAILWPVGSGQPESPGPAPLIDYRQFLSLLSLSINDTYLAFSAEYLDPKKEHYVYDFHGASTDGVFYNGQQRKYHTSDKTPAPWTPGNVTKSVSPYYFSPYPSQTLN